MTQNLFTLRSVIPFTLFLFFFTNHVKAQPRTGEFINISIGLGISTSYDDVDITGSGFYTQGEYIFGLTKWFGVRPYAGLLLTSEDKEGPTESKATTKAFLAGIKGRVLAPIPWVAPFIEIGIGASAGSFETITPFTDIQKQGVIVHIPFSFGLALGPKNSVDVEFTYYFHPAVEQFGGAAAFGITFPVN